MHCEEQLVEEIRKVEEKLRERRILVTCHRNADPDALAASIVTRNLLSRALGSTTVFSPPEGFSHASKRLVETFHINIGSQVIDPLEVLKKPHSIDAVVVVDTASIEQLGLLAGLAETKTLVVIDHHASNQLVSRACCSIYDTKAKAASEIVYIMASCLDYRLDELEANLLLAGIVYDTKRFMYTTPRTLRVASDLLSLGASMDRVLEAFKPEPMHVSERIARLKAAQRMIVLRSGETLVAITHVSAFEGSSARALLDLGADLAIILSPRGPAVRVVARAKPLLVEKMDIRLGRDIMEPLARRLSGSGGGHDLAAAAEVKGELGEVMNATIQLVKELFKARGEELKTLK